VAARARIQPVIIVQGGQWGSEGKGMVAAALCHQRQVDFAVRTGTVNAGHTVLNNGVPLKMQQLPTGWVNPTTQLVIGPGAYIHPDIIAAEVEMIESITGEDITKRLHIDPRCGLHWPVHTMRSKSSGRHHKMGATGKGCSEAVIDKIKGRGQSGSWTWGTIDPADCDRTSTIARLRRNCTHDTVEVLNEAYDDGRRILIEGTQGTLLDLHLGPYPFTTHKQTQAANWLAECGLSSTVQQELILVCRTLPIRVAGNSGPMPKETNWIAVTEDINSKLQVNGYPMRVSPQSLVDFRRACDEVAARRGLDDWKFEAWSPEKRDGLQESLSELHKEALELLSGPVLADLSRVFEFTTVTKKLRRIAKWDPLTMSESVMWNRPSSIALTFMNYWLPELWDRTTLTEGEWSRVKFIIGEVEDDLGVRVSYISTGPANYHLLPVTVPSAAGVTAQ
jgi:adenylosuccinate synthase